MKNIILIGEINGIRRPHRHDYHGRDEGFVALKKSWGGRPSGRRAINRLGVRTVAACMTAGAGRWCVCSTRPVTSACRSYKAQSPGPWTPRRTTRRGIPSATHSLSISQVNLPQGSGDTVVIVNDLRPHRRAPRRLRSRRGTRRRPASRRPAYWPAGCGRIARRGRAPRLPSRRCCGTKTRVRTTSVSAPPSDCSAPSILSIAKCVCAAASRPPISAIAERGRRARHADALAVPHRAGKAGHRSPTACPLRQSVRPSAPRSTRTARGIAPGGD